MKHFALAVALAAGASAFAECPPNADAQQPDAYALELADCLAHPDPKLRDGVGFEGLQGLLRGNKVSMATVQQLRTRLLADVAAPDDAEGFRKPFAALVLAEVARVDRLKPFLGTAERDDLVQRAHAYLTSVRDYRGFHEKEGWRHGVAHGADWMLQLSLNPQLTDSQRERVRSAIASQVIASNAHAYRYGEPERLMAPIYYLARSGWGTAQDWEKWFDALLARKPADTPFTQESLAARHNLSAFLSALYVATRESGNAQAESLLLPGLKKAMKALG